MMSQFANDRRQSKRSAVMLSAMVEQSAAPESSTVLNLSSQGALVAGPELMKGAYAWLRRNGVEVRARVAWTRENQSGFAFEKPLPPERLLRPIVSPTPPKRVDSRRPGLKAVPLTPGERMLFRCWADGPQC